MRHALLCLALSAATTAQADIRSESLRWEVDGVAMQGHFVLQFLKGWSGDFYDGHFWRYLC